MTRIGYLVRRAGHDGHGTVGSRPVTRHVDEPESAGIASPPRVPDARNDDRTLSGVAVRVSDVSKTYTTPAGVQLSALDNLSLTVDAGALVAVCGRSGSGKSTLLHVIGGMDTVDSGRIQVGDTVVTGLSTNGLVRHRRSVGFVFQRFHLLPALSALDNILAPLIPYRIGRAERRRGHELLDRIGLASRPDALPAQLSGGEQQRVAIARALINRPTLLLADEPTGNLDSTTGSAILDLITDIRSEHGMTVILATHDDGVANWCDTIVRLGDGRVDDDGTI